MRQATAVRKGTSFRIFILFAALAACFCVTVPRASAADEPGPCSADSATRQFDYWLGDWTISTNENPGTAASKVTLSLGNCVITENWRDGKGHSGENFFAYSFDDHSWRGMFVDNRGHSHVFVDGKVAGGTAEFDGPSRGPNGEAVLNRIRVVRISPNEVKQTWEKSTDNGASWTTVFAGTYSRAKP